MRAIIDCCAGHATFLGRLLGIRKRRNPQLRSGKKRISTHGERPNDRRFVSCDKRRQLVCRTELEL